MLEPNRASDVVISVEHLSKSYRLYPSHRERFKEALHPFRKRYHEEFWALRDVSFDLVRGRNVGILGRNGAGKSTLLQLIAGVLTPTSGKIMVAGRVSALLELGAGFNPELSGRENVALSSTLLGGPTDQLAQRIANVEAFADIGRFFDQPMKVYSSGMHARVAFANAIEVDPDILIVDEILGVGDAKFQEKCYDKLNSLRNRGVCILFVSHSTDVVQRNCEWALLLEQGRLVAEGDADAVVARYHDLLYGTRQIAEPPPRSNAKVGVMAAPDLDNAIDGVFREFLEDRSEPLYLRFPYYNPNERRLGSAEAQVVDFLVAANGDFHFHVLAGHEVLTIYLKVRFARDIAAPGVGWAIVSAEGIVIAGSNTVLRQTELPSARGGETWIYAIEIKPNLCGGQYFLNAGIGECNGHDWHYLDVRRSVIHLPVSGSGRGSGFFEMPSECVVVRAPQSTAEAVAGVRP